MHQQDVLLYKNLETRLPMPLPADPDLIVEELKPVHLYCYVWMNIFEVILTSFNIEFYRLKVRGDYNIIPKWFSRNQLPLSMENNSEAV